MRARWLSTIGSLVLMLQASGGAALAWEHWPGEWSPGRPSLGSRPAPSVERWIEQPAFRLELPFRTQKDGGQWQTSNCGPAILGMVLDGFGIAGQATDDLRYRSHAYQGTVGMRTGTALQHIARVAEDFGVATTGLYGESGVHNNWSIDDIRGQLRQGRPVMPLVRLYLLPGNEGLGARWGHYILLTGVAGDGFYYSDPLKPDPSSGIGRWIEAGQLAAAMQNSHIPGQAVAFVGPGVTALRVVAD